MTHSKQPSTDQADRYTLNPRFSWKRLPDGCIVLDLEKGNYFTLNRTAAAIWQGILDAQSGTAIAAGFAREYGIPLEQANRDVDEVLTLLKR